MDFDRIYPMVIEGKGVEEEPVDVVYLGEKMEEIAAFSSEQESTRYRRLHGHEAREDGTLPPIANSGRGGRTLHEECGAARLNPALTLTLTLVRGVVGTTAAAEQEADWGCGEDGQRGSIQRAGWIPCT